MSTETVTMRRRTSSTTSRDPITAVLIIIVACTALVQTANAAPAPTSFNADFDSWWYNACDSGHQSRHSAHKAKHNIHKDSCDDIGSNIKSTVKLALKTFMGHFRKEYKKYQKVMIPFSPYTQPAYEWLPKFKRPATNSKTFLQQYHLDLQKYAVAFYYLGTRQLKTEANDNSQNLRKQVLSKVLFYFKSLLCEVETAVNETCQEVPKRVPASLAKDEGLSEKADSITDQRLVDWGVLTRFNNYMKQSRNYFQKSFFKESNSDESEWDAEESATPSAEADGE